MQSKPRRFSKLVFLWLSLVVAALFVHSWGQAAASEQAPQAPDAPPLQWSDDFESYTVTSGFEQDADIWSSEWTHSGLKDMFVYNDHANSGIKSLKGHGIYDDCGGSVAYRPVGGFTPIEVEVWVRNDTVADRPLSGCHPVYGALELSTAPSFQGDHRGLLSFAYEEDGTGTPQYRIYGGGWEAPDPYPPAPRLYLQDFVLGEWYKVRVRYERLDAGTVQLTYWIDDVQLGQHEVPSRAFEGQLAYLGLWVGEGVAWHDDVTVYAGNEPPPDFYPYSGFLPLLRR